MVGWQISLSNVFMVRSAKGCSESVPKVSHSVYICSQLNLSRKSSRALRMARSKPPAAQPKFRLFVRFTFHMNASKVSPRNVSFIEHLLRKGVRQIEAYEDPAVKDCWVSEEMVSWDNDMRMAVQRKSTLSPQ